MKAVISGILLLAICACNSPRRIQRYYGKSVKSAIEQSPVFADGFSGFVLLDPATDQVVCSVNGDKYFTPASCTKILTLYTALHVLGDSIPSIQYRRLGDSIVFRGTGDPTFLHPSFNAWQRPFQWLRNAGKPLLLEHRTVYGFPLGPGWSWDDADEGYSAEKSDLPVFGNVTQVFLQDGKWNMLPKARKIDTLTSKSRLVYNGYRENRLYADRHGIKQPGRFHPPENYEQDIPIFNVSGLQNYLLYDTLPGLNLRRSPVNFVGAVKKPGVLYSTPVDTVYRKLMHQSDNFIAEQLLLVCAGVRFDSLSSEKMIRWTTDSLFKILPEKAVWVDGSGLSRYNLNTPHNLAVILNQLWKEQKYTRLFSLFPAGGKSGTLSGWYKNKENRPYPYIYAKSGSMTGVQCLSGYLITHRGKVLVFSFMHNNFTGNPNRWKAEMQRILEMIRDR